MVQKLTFVTRASSAESIDLGFGREKYMPDIDVRVIISRSHACTLAYDAHSVIAGSVDAAPKARLVAVVADGAMSRLGREVEVTSEAVMHHMARRLTFVDQGYQLEVYTDSKLLV